MTIKVLFSADAALWQHYQQPLESAFETAGLDVDLKQNLAPEDVDYIVYAPNDGLNDFSPFIHAKAVLALWAGVEGIVGNETLTMPLTRMVDEGLTDGMVEWVTGQVLRHHLGLDQQIMDQTSWTPVFPPLARNRRVGILGLGALGKSCAMALARLNFDVSGWSRSAKHLEGIRTLSGEDGLKTLLSNTDILVLLLPLTPTTENLLDAENFARLPKGAVIINPGRGALIDDDALIRSLDQGHLSHATLDVFRIEPLPADHPFWAHPQITVTPHIASTTRPDTAAQVIAQNIQRGQEGKSFLHLVDRSAGY